MAVYELRDLIAWTVVWALLALAAGLVRVWRGSGGFLAVGAGLLGMAVGVAWLLVAGYVVADALALIGGHRA